METLVAEKLDLKGVSLRELQEFVAAHGQPKFRASQIFSWLYNKKIFNRVNRLEDMANLSNECIRKILPVVSISDLSIETFDNARCAFAAQDGAALHSAIKDGKVYLSTQIGCSYRCEFCPYGKIDLVRNLKTGELVDQVVKLQGENVPIEKVSFGAMGEPLMNYDSVMNSLRIICSPWGLGIPFKNISLYTCGIVPKILKIAEKRMPLKLFIGLHSVDDKIRASLMNVNNEYPVDDLLKAVKYFGRMTGMTVRLEYIILKDINDSYADAKLLIRKLLGLPVKLVLASYEPVHGGRFATVNFDRQEEFLNTLIAGNIKAELKDEKG